MTNPTSNAAKARRASQLLADIDVEEKTLVRLKCELSKDAANLAASLDDDAEEGEYERMRF